MDSLHKQVKASCLVDKEMMELQNSLLYSHWPYELGDLLADVISQFIVFGIHDLDKCIWNVHRS